MDAAFFVPECVPFVSKSLSGLFKHQVRMFGVNCFSLFADYKVVKFRGQMILFRLGFGP